MSGINPKVQSDVSLENQKHAVGFFSTSKKHGRTRFKHRLASLLKRGLQINRNGMLRHDALTLSV